MTQNGEGLFWNENTHLSLYFSSPMLAGDRSRQMVVKCLCTLVRKFQIFYISSVIFSLFYTFANSGK